MDFWTHLDSGFGLWTEVQIAGEEPWPRLIFWTLDLDLGPSPIWTFGLLGISSLGVGLEIRASVGFGLRIWTFGLPIWT